MTQCRDKYLWITDSHLYVLNRFKMLNAILDEKPKGVFLTGDISSCFQTLVGDLEFLGKRIGRPIYMTLGNHDYWGSDFKTVNLKIKELCDKYKNIVWMTNAGIISLNEEVAIIGNEGWYDCRVGNSEYVKYTLDWLLIKDFRELKTFKERIEAFRELSKKYTKDIVEKLEKALENHKTVYLLSHFPAWREANRGSLFGERFFEPYNTNVYLGQQLEKVMEKNKRRQLQCLFGHTHTPVQIHAARNITALVGRGAYHKFSGDEIIYI